MNNKPEQTRYFTRRGRRRGRRPVLFGAAALTSVVLLALGGLLLVGLDTVGSQGKQLTRLSQPEAAQTPEVTGERSSEEGNPDKSNPDKGSSNGGGGDAGKAADSEGKGSGEKREAGGSKKEQKEEPRQQVKKEPDPPAPSDPTMWMSIPRLGMQSDTVYNDDTPSTMDIGAIKLPSTGFPWQDGANTYISAHRIGYPGTQSDDQFYNLPAMQQNDVIYLGDANGTTYEYRVSEKFAVSPWENSVTEPQAGRDMITLQTCVDAIDPSTWWNITPALMESGPDTGRLIVQAEKVDTYPAQ